MSSYIYTFMLLLGGGVGGWLIRDYFAEVENSWVRGYLHYKPDNDVASTPTAPPTLHMTDAGRDRPRPSWYTDPVRLVEARRLRDVRQEVDEDVGEGEHGATNLLAPILLQPKSAVEEYAQQRAVRKAADKRLRDRTLWGEEI